MYKCMLNYSLYYCKYFKNWGAKLITVTVVESNILVLTLKMGMSFTVFYRKY